MIAFIAIATLSFTCSVNNGAEKDTNNESGNFISKDLKTDNLLTSENTVLLVIDWQDEMLGTVRNIDKAVLTNNIQAIIKTANVFNVPVIGSTIGVELGANKPTVPSIKEVIEKDVENIDRISLNAWQNKAFIKAVKKTGSKKKY
ncbi:MAG: hypothetical protein V3U54_02865 [Thermodesulfobacteriota bacterium]